MLHFSRSKTLLILGVCLLGILLAVPNFLAHRTLPPWIPQPRVNLGLDLQGGSYLLLEVDMKTVVRDRLTNLRSEVRQALAKAQVAHRGVDILEQGVSVQLASEQDAAAPRKALGTILQLRSDGPANALFLEQRLEGARLVLTLSPAALADMATKAVEQSVSIVRRRSTRRASTSRPLRARAAIASSSRCQASPIPTVSSGFWARPPR
jgi:SecD/SecF fusion protein